jgi:hypothetical protein
LGKTAAHLPSATLLCNADTFVSFNTTLPRDREKGHGEGFDDNFFSGPGDVNSKINDYAARAGEDLEIYDFNGLRQGLEEDDGLADQLVEANDDLNDITFSVEVRKDGTCSIYSIILPPLVLTCLS